MKMIKRCTLLAAVLLLCVPVVHAEPEPAPAEPWTIDWMAGGGYATQSTLDQAGEETTELAPVGISGVMGWKDRGPGRISYGFNGSLLALGDEEKDLPRLGVAAGVNFGRDELNIWVDGFYDPQGEDNHYGLAFGVNARL